MWAEDKCLHSGKYKECFRSEHGIKQCLAAWDYISRLDGEIGGMFPYQILIDSILPRGKMVLVVSTWQYSYLQG